MRRSIDDACGGVRRSFKKKLVEEEREKKRKKKMFLFVGGFGKKCLKTTKK